MFPNLPWQRLSEQAMVGKRRRRLATVADHFSSFLLARLSARSKVWGGKGVPPFAIPRFLNSVICFFIYKPNTSPISTKDNIDIIFS